MLSPEKQFCLKNTADISATVFHSATFDTPQNTFSPRFDRLLFETPVRTSKYLYHRSCVNFALVEKVQVFLDYQENFSAEAHK